MSQFKLLSIYNALVKQEIEVFISKATPNSEMDLRLICKQLCLYGTSLNSLPVLLRVIKSQNSKVERLSDLI